MEEGRVGSLCPWREPSAQRFEVSDDGYRGESGRINQVCCYSSVKSVR